ncbi:hypothetical protein [Pseudomonas syringae]|uniref:hypothetical protein n=1 Tax=Pseudomonas syringae TaxID=317 RepID=UPI001071B38F|nr:hypothetical protein [Pseudomonas syringae]
MITNVPSADDFFRTGKELLIFSWDGVTKLLIELDDAERYGYDTSDMSENYWSLAQRNMATYLTVMQQGLEFIVKGRICEISPYILISDAHSKWPSPYAGDIDFSTFRTIDAQDLTKVHDSFAPTKLSRAFIDRFGELRQIRNSIMHSVNNSFKVTFIEIIESLLFMHKELFPGESWAKLRRGSLELTPAAELGAYEYVSNYACQELSIIIKLLSKSKVITYFKIDRSRRGYMCPKCKYDASSDIDFEYRLARLTTVKPRCKTLYCPVCDDEYPVVRRKCTAGGCLGNVLGGEYEECLTCGH